MIKQIHIPDSIEETSKYETMEGAYELKLLKTPQGHLAWMVLLGGKLLPGQKVTKLSHAVGELPHFEMTVCGNLEFANGYNKEG